jgi:hypothetical protein
MSYSYVKTVFPDFKYSNVYDTKLYDNLNVSKNDNRLFEPIETDVSKNYANITLAQEVSTLNKEPVIETFQDNQRFYNPPLPASNIPLNNNRINRERFDEEPSQKHLEYTKHVLECPSCKEILMKQFNLENERIRNEEIMELISYLIFGLFILLLIDTYAKK